MTDTLVTANSVSSLALPLLAATRAGALACRSWVGRGEPKLADGAAVAALRDALARLPGRATVVIGEGEKDAAPMLYAGEVLGTGDGPACDLAVDPLEGTRLCARGQAGSVSVLAAAPPGALWASSGWYMEKLVVSAAAAGAVSLKWSPERNLAALAVALDKPVKRLVVAVQDRPRHAALIASLRQAGAAVALFGDGDVMTSLRVLLPGGDIDALMGIGGAPEGVIMACAARLMGGDMQGRLATDGTARGDILRLGDLVGSGDCVFAATRISDGSGVLATPDHPGLRIDSLDSETVVLDA